MDENNLLSPPIISLDGQGRALYRLMRQSEAALLSDLRRRYEARIYVLNEHAGQMEWAHPTPPPLGPEAPRRHRVLQSTLSSQARAAREEALREAWRPLIGPEVPRRYLTLMSPESLNHREAINALMDQRLQPARAEFRDWLDANRDERTQSIGRRSLALPAWIEPHRSAERIRYSFNPAFRAGELSPEQIRGDLRRRIEASEASIATAQQHRQRERLRQYEISRAALTQDLHDLETLLTRHGGRLIARVASGTGLKFRAKWQDGGETGFGLPHLVLMTAAPSCPVERAPRRQRGSRYGQPVAQMAGGRLEVYVY